MEGSALTEVIGIDHVYIAVTDLARSKCSTIAS